MITFITGTPGTGKTLNAVKRYILPALKSRRLLYTNIPLSCLHLCLCLPDFTEAEIEALIQPYSKHAYKSVKTNSLIVIDECQNFYNNRDFKDQDNKDFIEFLTKHRHYGVDVIILTQHYEQVDIGIRRNAETCIVLKSLRNIGFSSQIKAEFFGNALDLNRKPVGSKRWSIDPSIYSLYKSYENETVVETKKTSFNVFLRSPMFWIMVIVVAWFVWTALSGKYGFLYGKKEGNLLAGGRDVKPALITDLGEYEEYYCGDKFYVLRLDGKIDTLQPKAIPPSWCPRIGFNFRRQK